MDADLFDTICVALEAPSNAPATNLAGLSPQQAAECIDGLRHDSGERLSFYQKSIAIRFLERTRDLARPPAPAPAATSGAVVPVVAPTSAVPLSEWAKDGQTIGSQGSD